MSTITKANIIKYITIIKANFYKRPNYYKKYKIHKGKIRQKIHPYRVSSFVNKIFPV